MKNINKEDNTDFEKSWERAFEDAEISPGNGLWSNIDAKLANKDADRFKRKILFYKWVAAASLVLAVSISYLTYLFGDHSALNKQFTENVEAVQEIEEGASEAPTTAGSAPGSEDKSAIAAVEAPSQTPSDLPVLGEESENESKAVKDEQEVSSLAYAGSDSDENSLGSPLATDGEIANTNLETSASEVAEKGSISTGALANNEQIPAIEEHTIRNVVAPMVDNDDDAVQKVSGLSSHLIYAIGLMEAPYIYAIPGVMVMRDEKEERNNKRTLWAGLNVGSSMFDPNFQQGSNFKPKTSPALTQSFARDAAPQIASHQEHTDPGFSYSLGLNFGVRLSDRWVVQSGVQYANRSASTNSTTSLQNNFNKERTPSYLGNPNSDILSNYSKNNIALKQEYDIVNTFEFATIPLKAGYVLIDKKVGLLVSAGIAADIFLSNTLSEDNNRIEKVTTDAGKQSPYREFNFNGLLGAEFFYAISNQYHLTLEPNYSIALSPFTKSGEDFKSTPQVFGLSAGLKYYLK